MFVEDMIVPKRCVRENPIGAGPFLKKMFELDLPFLIKRNRNFIDRICFLRFRFKGDWINFVRVVGPSMAGIAPYVLSNMTGKFILIDTPKFIKDPNNKGSKLRLPSTNINLIKTTYDGDYFPSDLDIISYTNIATLNIEKHTIPFYGLIPKAKENGDVIVTGRISYKAKDIEREQALNNLESIRIQIERSETPLALKSKPNDAYLLKTGWEEIYPTLYRPVSVKC